MGRTLLFEIEDFLNDYMNFDDPSVGIYSVGELNKEQVNEILDYGFDIVEWDSRSMTIQLLPVDRVKIALVEYEDSTQWEIVR